MKDIIMEIMENLSANMRIMSMRVMAMRVRGRLPNTRLAEIIRKNANFVA